MVWATDCWANGIDWKLSIFLTNYLDENFEKTRMYFYSPLFFMQRAQYSLLGIKINSQKSALLPMMLSPFDVIEGLTVITIAFITFLRAI